MPLYNYVCDDCGPFEEWNSITLADSACGCPNCQMPSHRDVSVPHLSLMNPTLRRAMDRADKSSGEPRVVKKKHLAGCGCSLCKLGNKPTPTRRRWSIGH